MTTVSRKSWPAVTEPQEDRQLMQLTWTFQATTAPESHRASTLSGLMKMTGSKIPEHNSTFVTEQQDDS